MKLWQPEIFSNYGIGGYFSEKIDKSSLNDINIPIFFPKQTHSDRVIILEEDSPLTLYECDGVLSLRQDIVLGVQTSDCVPILIADKRRRLVGAVHAGWRGTVKGILSKALQMVIDIGIKPEEILIALGPHIQATCYEVKEDVLSHLKSPLNRSPFIISKGESHFLNLAALNLSQALEYHIPKENIWLSRDCTHCLEEKYHSYRREGNYLYTQIALISINSKGI